MRTQGAFVMFLMWIKCFYWGKLFENSAYFITQLNRTIGTVIGFGSMLIIVLLAFTNFYFIIQTNVENEDNDYVAPYTGLKFLDAFISMYLISLGEFELQIDGYQGGHDKYVAWIMFLFSTLVLLLLFMNMLIAVMAEPFLFVSENANLYKYQQQISIIVDCIDVLDLKEIFSGKKYILIVRPETNRVEHGENMRDYIIDKVTKELDDKHELMEKKVDLLKDIFEK
jgi:hypothetical protein